MFSPDQYELLDFGNGWKVERFGDQVIARQSRSVERFDTKFELSSFDIDCRYDSRWHGEITTPWSVSCDELTFNLRQTPTGQVGIFPEQQSNWQWIREQREAIAGRKAINLFAYTGGTTMALTSAGAHVTHVDSASSVVAWARENAKASDLADHPIRWIVEDATKFVMREIKRGNRYEIFVADPPSFGRGPKNETWKIERDIAELTRLAAELCPNPIMMILSCHTPGLGTSDLSSMIRHNINTDGAKISEVNLQLVAADGGVLPSGDCVRFVRGD